MKLIKQLNFLIFIFIFLISHFKTSHAQVNTCADTLRFVPTQNTSSNSCLISTNQFTIAAYDIFIPTGTVSATNTGTITTAADGSPAISYNGLNATLVTINNSGTLTTTGIQGSHGIALTNGNPGIIINSGTITTSGIESSAISYSGADGGTITNSGTLSSLTSQQAISVGANNVIVNINKGSIITGDINQGNRTGGTINFNLGASKSYAYKTTSTIGTWNVNDLNNRPLVNAQSAFAINIGSMETAGENLYQKTANITDAVDRNAKNNKDTWVEPYYSESTRDSGGDSSQIRQFKNNKQGVNAGFKVANSSTPLQAIFNVDQTKNNIDSSEHIINSDSVMIGLTAPSYGKYEGFDVSVKGLVGYANSKTDRKILDNTSSTGERTLTGEYDSYYAVVGSALSKNYNLDKDLNANLTLGVDLTSEFRDSYSENLYFKYNSLELIQLQPRIQSEFIKTTGKDSNVFLTAGVGAREVLSGKTQKYSMNNTGVSFTAPNSGDYYASLAAGTNMNVAANVNFYTLISAKMSDRDTETYQASIGLKGTF
jgi:hypothetical protein